MARYFFDCHDGIVAFRDETGTECEHHEAACIEAVKAMADLARQYFPTATAVNPAQNLLMTVRSCDGQQVLQLDLKLTVIPLN